MKDFTKNDRISTKKTNFNPEPKKSTLDFIKNFSRAYQVPKIEQIKGTAILLN